MIHCIPVTHPTHIAAQQQGPGPHGPDSECPDPEGGDREWPDRESSSSEGPSPDTEVSPPLAPGSSPSALDGDSIASATRSLPTVPGPHSAREPDARRPANHTTSAQDLKTTQKSQLAPSRSTSSAAPGQELSLDPAASNTTLHSMRKPELVPGAVPHSRRFLSIEHELVEFNLALRVLQKQTARAERRLFFAMLTAGCAMVLALLALAK